MTELILHLGAHKTGTSLIQKYMMNNGPLMKRNGLAFIKRSEGNVYLGWGKPKFVKEQAPSFRQRIDPSVEASMRAFIVSHENALGRPVSMEKPGLYPDAARAAAALKEALAPYDIRVIHYIRDQDSFIESYYLQRINEGRSFAFREWLSGIDLASLSWAPTVETLRSVFGADRVSVRDFSTEIAGGQAAYLESFFRFALRDLDPKTFIDFAYETHWNPSIGDKGLAIALAANPLLTTDQEKKRMRVFLQEHFSNRDYPRPTLLEPDEKAALRERYAAENRGLVDRAA